MRVLKRAVENRGFIIPVISTVNRYREKDRLWPTSTGIFPSFNGVTDFLTIVDVTAKRPEFYKAF
jgi:hypothetical protein